MSEVLRDLVVSLSLDGDNFSRNLTSINKQIQEAESEFKRAASGVDNFEKSVSGTQSQLSSLQQKLALRFRLAVPMISPYTLARYCTLSADPHCERR